MKLLDEGVGGHALRDRSRTEVPLLRIRGGGVREVPVHQWMADATDLERTLLRRVVGPVLDLGCGPGRLVAALGELGVTVLGVDTSPRAVAMAQERGAAVLERSIFDHLPGAGRWRTTLLLDGNLGIGGDTARLLRRSAELLGVGGTTLVEVEPPGYASEVLDVRLEVGDRRSHWFPWAVVGVDGLVEVAGAGGHTVAQQWTTGDRWFAHLSPMGS